MRGKHLLATRIALALVLGSLVQASAALRTWDGGGANDFWTTAANWSPNTAPVAGDDLEFAGGTPLLSTNNYAANTMFGNITFSSPGYLVRGNPLALTNGITLLGAIGPIAFHPDLTLNADQTFTISRLNASLDLHGAVNLNGHTPTFFLAGTANAFGPMSGVGGLVQTSGTLVLHTNNSFSGTAQLNGGTMLVHNANPNINANVNAGATLGGTGSVRRIISAGGAVAPGSDEPGILSATATTTFDAATTFAVQLNGLAPGSGHDQLSAASAALGNATLSVSVGYPLLVGDSFVILDVTGASPITGTFGGLAEGALFVAGNVQFQITYTGGTGNDVVLTALAQQPSGVTRTWDGGGADNLWTTPANWVGDVAPAGGDALSFPAAAAQLSNVNDYPHGFVFDSIEISGAGYNITGNRVALLSITGLRASYPSGTSTLGVDIDLLGDLIVVNFVATLPTLVLSGDISLGSHDISFVCEGPITLSGVVSGTGGVFKGKSPALQLAGATPNTYTGPTTILGLCELNKTGGAVAVAGPLFIGNDAAAAAEVRLLGDDQISDASAVTVFTGGTLALNGFDDTIGSLCLTGGVVTTMSGTLTVLEGVETKPSTTVASISGNLALGGAGDHPFTIANGAATPDLNVSAVLSGGAGTNLVKTGTGQLRFSGSAANTLSGMTKVNQGILQLSKTVNTHAIAGPLVIGDGAGGMNADRVVLLVDHQIADTAPVTINASGQLDLNNQDDAIGPLTMIAGSVVTGTGMLTLAADVQAEAAASPSLLGGQMFLGPAALRVFDIAQSATMEVSAVISGGPALTMSKIGRGELRLVTANLFSGPVSIVGGSLTITANGALGNATGATALDGGRLRILDTHVTEETLVVNSGTVEGDGTSSWSGPAVLNGDMRVLADAGDQLTFVGPWSGVGGFIKTGEGVLRFHGPDPNTHTGTNRVEAGELQLYRFLGGQDVISIPGPLIVGDGFGGAGADVVIYGGPGEITDTAPVAIQSSGLVRLQSWSDTIGSLSGSGSLMLDSGRLALGGDNGSATFSGVISGTGPLTKVGIGAQTLSGNNTYLGQTSVSNGTLIVNGQQPSSPVFVYDGGTLGGNGTVQRINVLGGGRLSPGTSPGILSAGGIVNFQDATATYLVELNGLTAGADYDQLNAPFGVALGNAALQVTLGFAPAPGASFVILNKGGAAQVVGTFDGLPEGATFPAGGLLFQITYAGGDGNDVVLTRVAAAASQIQGLASLPDGSKEIQGLGAPGLAYTLEAATNLSAPVLWLPLGTVTADGAGAYQFIDADAPLHPMRFYRVLSP